MKLFPRVSRKHLNLIIAWFGLPFLSFFILGNLYAYLKIKDLKLNAYRSHDKYITLEKYIDKLSRYKSNLNVSGANKYGDLCAMAGFSFRECPFSESIRKHQFITDKRGWKTKEKLEDSDYVIVGDSFLAALGGDDMNEQFGQYLNRITGQKFYEAAYPGEPYDYIQRINEIEKEEVGPGKYILMIFEGNDLDIVENNKIIKNNNSQNLTNFFQAKIEYYYNKIPLVKLTKYYTQASFNSKKREEILFTKKIKGFTQAFFIEQNIISEKDGDIKSFDLILKNSDKICSIIFIPTAYSVYLTDESTFSRHPSLKKSFKTLEESQIEVIDTTNYLRGKAKISDESIFWHDDTHWNKRGIKAAAEFFASKSSCLKKP